MSFKFCLSTGVTKGVAAIASATMLALSAFSPASAQVITSSRYFDELARPTAEAQEKVRDFAAQPWVTPQLRSMLLTALNFAAGTNDGEGVALPQNISPAEFTQFEWPSVAGTCIGGTLDSVGTAIAVPGPKEIPAPGVKAGEVGFVFTALGTKPAAIHQDMRAHWFNLDNFTFGTTNLEHNGINPEGPATISGVANTGKGTVLALIEGAINTEESTCVFAPTAAIIDYK